MRTCIRTGGRRGGALVGILMVTPALTLLGAAILSLASRESERTRAQWQGTQALAWAEAAQARAAWALAAGRQLQEVAAQLPPGIALTQAQQGARTSGAVLADGTPVTVTTVGVAGAERRTVQQAYDTQDLLDFYKNVLVSPGKITVASPNPPVVVSTVNGTVRTGDPTTNLSSVLGNHPVTVGSVPQLDIAGYIAAMLAKYPNTAVNSGQITSSNDGSPYFMDAVNGTPVYYTNDPGLNVANNGAGAHVKIRGTVFWIIEGGAQFGKEITISAYDSSARLVIVASKNPSSHKGWDLDKLGVINVPTVLVSNGKLYYNKESILSNISMYGSQIDAAKGQDFTYDPAVMDPFIDALKSAGNLPLPQGLTTTLVRKGGSWLEVIPSL